MEQFRPRVVPSLAPTLALGSVLVVLALGAGAASAETSGFGLEPASRPPTELPSPLRAALAPEGVRVVEEGRPLLRIWWRAQAPASEGSGGAAHGLGVAFGDLPEGALLGLMVLEREWTDYRGQTVSPGLYTLRYLVEPADGAHTGVSYYRDFLLLVPVEQDDGPATVYSEEELVDASRGAAGTNHPAVLALFPVRADSTPAIVDNETGQPTLAVELPGADGGEARILGLVLRGVGEI